VLHACNKENVDWNDSAARAYRYGESPYMTRFSWCLALTCFAQAGCARGSEATPLRLGTTTTVEQSGALSLLDSLHPPRPVRVIVGPSGTIIRSAAAGDLDVIVTHAPSLEQRLLVNPGHAALRCPFVVSRFAVVGPAGDPARVTHAASATEAFRRIASVRASFISRGDSSGTHVKELSLWKAAGITPVFSRDRWYTQSGSDQAATLRTADERHAYALDDLPTFTRLAGIELQVLFTADTALGNPYTLYVIRSASPNRGAAQFATWALGDWRARLLAVRLPNGVAAFMPPAPGSPDGCVEPVSATAER